MSRATGLPADVFSYQKLGHLPRICEKDAPAKIRNKQFSLEKIASTNPYN